MRTLLSLSGATVAVLLALGSAESSRAPAHPVGEHVIFSDADWVVEGVEDLGPHLTTSRHLVGTGETESSGRFVQVTFTLENRSAQTWTPTLAPRLSDDQDRSYSALPITMHPWYVPRGTPKYRWHDLRAGQAETYTMIYDVTEPDARGLTLEVGTLMDEDDPQWALVDLGL